MLHQLVDWNELKSVFRVKCAAWFNLPLFNKCICLVQISLQGTGEGRMKKVEVEDKKTESRPREWQRTGSCYLGSSVWPQLTGALSWRESWTISLQWSGICSLADWQNTPASSHHEARLPIQMGGWLAADYCLQKWADIRFPLIGSIFSCSSFISRKWKSLAFTFFADLDMGTACLHLTLGELLVNSLNSAELRERVLHEWSRIDMRRTLYFCPLPLDLH